jgi:hypothetical protein
VTLEDMLLEQKLAVMGDVDSPRLRMQAEADRLELGRRHPAFAARGMVASLLVRAGVWIDRRAGERAYRLSTR